METERAPEVIVALYGALADAQAAQEELQDAGIPYPDIRLHGHAATDPDRPALDLPNPPERFWSLTVVIDEPGRDQRADEVLRKHAPLAIGRMPAPNKGRSAADRGAIAWRHYVFETPAATDTVGEGAGTTGTTGVISSGVFATNANAEGNPPARGLAPEDHRPANDETATTDDRAPETATDRSRPQTELH